jgi:hypothetical protein
MNEFAMVLLTLIPLEVLLPDLPSPTPSAVYPSRGPGRGAYVLGGFIGLGILLSAMALLRLRPKGRQGRRPDH